MASICDLPLSTCYTSDCQDFCLGIQPSPFSPWVKPTILPTPSSYLPGNTSITLEEHPFLVHVLSDLQHFQWPFPYAQPYHACSQMFCIYQFTYPLSGPQPPLLPLSLLECSFLVSPILPIYWLHFLPGKMNAPQSMAGNKNYAYFICIKHIFGHCYLNLILLLTSLPL